jgi:hypothetical protein
MPTNESTTKTVTEITSNQQLLPAGEPSLAAKTDYAFLMVCVSFFLGSMADIYSQLATFPHHFVAQEWEVTIWMSILGLKTVTTMIANKK